MIADIDLLGDDPSVHRVPLGAVIRRVLAAGLIVAADGAVVPLVEGVRPAPAVPVPAADPDPSLRREPAATTPSRILAAADATGWRLSELTLRSDGHRRALGSLRFDAPAGRPALPDRLVEALAAEPALDALVTVALTATEDGTAVEVAGAVPIDVSPRVGDPVPSADLPAHLAAVVEAAGGQVRGVLAGAPSESTSDPSVALSFDAPPRAAERILRAIEGGASAPARISSVRVRRVDGTLSVELVLTARPVRVSAP